jgi:uncharacterized alkaline shock family protein YloU
MAKTKEKPYDDLKSEGFIKQTAALAATESFGVVGMSYKNAFHEIADILTSDKLGRGVKVKYLDTDTVELDLYVVMEFGTRLVVVAESLIDSVRYNVEKQSGVKVKKVNVHVQYVRV